MVVSDLGLAAEALATILCEEGQQVVHQGEVRAVDEGAALAPAVHDPCTAELLQVEGEGGARDLQSFRHRTGGQALGSGLNQQAEDIEPSFVGDGC